MRRLVMAAVGLLAAGGALALDNSSSAIVRTAKSLMDSGRYVRCGLDMKPDDAGGYYRCFDFGPYRVIEDYPRLSVFVIGEGAPFRVYSAEGGRGSFMFQGPWIDDLAPRLAKHAADAVAGKDKGPNDEARRLDAEARIGRLIDAERPKPPPAPAATPDIDPAPAPAPSVATTPSRRDFPVPPVAGTPGAPVGDDALKAALEAAGMSGRR